MTTRFVGALLLAVLVPAAAVAQVPIQLPRPLIFPNYDRVLLGKDQALEGGAFIARTADASANFYNPAGLVQSEKSSLNASSAGWVRTRLSSETLGTSVQSSKIDGVPGYFGAVAEPPFFDTRQVRVGASITRQVAWAPGGIDQSVEPATVPGLDRVTYSSSSDFSTQLYQVAVAWAPADDRALRLGLSLGMANTSYSANGTLSGLVTVGGVPGQFLSTLRAGGNEWDFVGALGVQWDVTSRLTVGAVVRSPSVKMTSGSLVTYESAVLAGTNATTFFRDEGGAFEYKQPMSASLGVAYRFDQVELEADLRWHGAIDRYDFYRSSQTLQVLTRNPDGSTTPSTQAMPTLTYEARQVFNVAVGGNYHLSKVTTVHGGFYTSFSPVVDASASPFRQADLYGVTGGFDFQWEHFGISLGVGYEWGSAPPSPFSVGDEQVTGTGVDLQAISLLYAVSYSF